MSCVYLAGPIDQVDEDEAQTWRRQLANILIGHGIGTFDPTKAYTATRQHAEFVSVINRHAVTCSLCVVAYVSKDAFGTIREIEHARRTGVPVIVWTQNTRLSGSFEAWDLHVTDDWDEVVDVVVQLHKQERNKT